MKRRPSKPPPPTLPEIMYVRGSNYPDPTRTSKRPTVSFNQFMPDRVQEVILGVFKRKSLPAMDLEALIFFVLQEFDVTPTNYETMHKTVKAHIFKNFAIHQGSQLRLSDVCMRRITVCLTDTD